MFEKLKNKTILLVEDESVIRNNIAMMLKHFFKSVYTAEDGFEGLDQYETHLPDIVMTDLKMPNMGGFELLEELRKRSSHAYTIIVSAHTDRDLLIQAIHDGVDRYLVKPLTEDELFGTFNAFLEKLEKESPDVVTLSENITVNFERSEASLHGQVSHLNKKEILLLKLLLNDIRRTFTYEEIENQVWGSKSMSLAALRSVVRDLRKKIGQNYLINISGTGYRMQ